MLKNSTLQAWETDHTVLTWEFFPHKLRSSPRGRNPYSSMLISTFPAPPEAPLSSPVPAPAVPPVRGGGEGLALRRLRHLTRDTLQLLICQIEDSPELLKTAAGRRLAEDLSRRIQACAAVSDCLFGLTAEPADPLEERLQSLCDNLLRLLADRDPAIRVMVSCDGSCPPGLADDVMAIAHELVSNALRHGMYARITGRIGVRLVTEEGRTTLSIRDDGWGFRDPVTPGEGLAIAQRIASRYGGHVSLRREKCATEAVAVLPHRHAARGPLHALLPPLSAKTGERP